MKNLKRLTLIPAFLLFLLFINTGCKKEEDFVSKDDKLIQEYLLENNLVAQKTASGLYYIISDDGVDPKPVLSSQVTVHYKGYLLDGSEFESSYSGSAPTFPLANVIDGWREGLQLFGKGGKGTLYIPSGLAYGASVMPGIPANSVLIFDIHLINIK